MVDIFEEVEGQLRSDRYRTLALKALPWVVGLLVLALVVTLGVWAYNNHREKADAKASEAYVAGIEALQAGDSARAFVRFGEAAKAGSKGYAALALIQQGGIRLAQGKDAEAVALLDQAAESADDPLLSDTARLQAVYALLDDGAPVEIDGRLKPLLAEGRPYRSQAREAHAMALLRQGKGKEARADFLVLSQGLDTPQDVRERAGAAIAMIDSGVASSLPAVLKAAKAMPAQPLQSTPPQSGTAQ